ncbi:MAG TPA: SPFH domain-containing protein, partial [Stellaceae bacterium]|nr:SPFH domain-containing protein [Stellaceae bacterium]
GIDVVDTRIRSALLPPQNSEAIYARMNSERQKQAALYRAEGSQEASVVRANADRERTVILAEAQKQSQELRGEGDATAIAVYAKAYGQDKSFFAFYRSLEAYRRAFTGKGTSFVLSPTSSFFKYFVSPNATPGADLPPAAQPSKKPAAGSRPHG